MIEQVSTDLFRSLGPSYLTGPCYFGAALNQTGQAIFFNSSSALSTTLQAGNATAALAYTLPTAGPASNNYLLASSTVGVLSWLNAAGTYAPIGSAFVTIGADATLTAERALTGTSNQVVITDNGAGSTVVLSTPQNIHTGASPTFTGMTLSAALAMGTAKITGLGNGTASTDAAAFGQIKYVVAPVLTENTTDFTTTANTYQTTNLTASITPTSASNRIRISISGMMRTSGVTEAFLTIARGTTDLAAAANGFARFTGAIAAVNQRTPVSAIFIDSPATTSSTTYNVRVRNDDGVGTVGFGGGTSQVMILEEVV